MQENPAEAEFYGPIGCCGNQGDGKRTFREI